MGRRGVEEAGARGLDVQRRKVGGSFRMEEIYVSLWSIHNDAWQKIIIIIINHNIIKYLSSN